jgi:regulator of protease activity HflC (stomatin/prohibitin superfamily)
MRRLRRLRRTPTLVAALALLFVFVLLAPRIFILVEPGEEGVLYRPLEGGTVTERTYGEGLWILWPWNRMYVYDTRIAETRRTLGVLTRDGLTVTLDLSIRYRPDVGKLAVLHKTVGPQYVEKIVVPEVLSAVRQQIGNQTADELYTGRALPDVAVDAIARAAAMVAPLSFPSSPRIPLISAAETPNPQPADNVTLAEIVSRAAQTVSRRYVVIDGVVLIKTTLPRVVDAAIQAKMEQKQRAEAQLFRIQYAQREVMLRQFEARGNVVLAGSLTPSLLTWKSIEASASLATAPNSKVIVMGNSEGKLPLLLGSDMSPDASRR